MSFEITFLGCSGGPIESSNCAILVKPANLSYGDILKQPNAPLLLIDAGAGLLLLAETIANEGYPPNRLLMLYKDSLPLDSYIKVRRSHPFKDLKGPPIRLLAEILSKLSGALISHPHADHILAVVLNSPGMCKSSTLQLYGSEFTMETMRNHVFNGYVWPKMVELGVLQLNVVSPLQPTPMCTDAYTVTRFNLSHGKIDGSSKSYESLAFLLTCSASGSKLLAFGDFEADSVLGLQRNRAVWEYVAPYILDGSLKCIILECSTHSASPDTELYGHLTPRHLIEELNVLYKLASVKKRNPLKNLDIIITHVKENTEGRDPRRQIQSELEELNSHLGLGLKITMALSGISIVI